MLLVTHNVVEAERGVARLAVLHRGRIVAEGTPAQLRGGHGGRLRLELVAPDATTAAQLAGEYRGADPAIQTGRRVVVPILAPAASAAIGWAEQQRARGRLDEFSVTPVSLEDVYIGLVEPVAEDGHAARAA